ncbi:MAG TPA: alpha/beta fold hydrolase, partial [Pirellulales bacterium]|jgi:pimeloyl-ACP methyl ester carboxylesterase
MLEPYVPGKIPVLMVHGLWSSPLTWMEMFNDLRSSKEIRDNYQFWFYEYPTGQPFWDSAAQLREDLVKARNTLDPNHAEPALDQMVLVGHSMGGLLSKLQIVDSGDEFWHTVSDEPLDRLNLPDDTKRDLAREFYFRPNPSVRRVITIATPHRGSKFANDTTRWLAQRMIALPKAIVRDEQQVYKDNPGVIHKPSPIQVVTSIDSLSPNVRLFPVMLNSPRPNWVRFHNIVGEVSQTSWIAKIAGRGDEGTDGAVSYESAHLDNVDSEIIVPADHLNVHRHPLAVLEVRRILLLHLDELRNGPKGNEPHGASPNGPPPNGPANGNGPRVIPVSNQMQAAAPRTSEVMFSVGDEPGSRAVGADPLAPAPTNEARRFDSSPAR